MAKKKLTKYLSELLQKPFRHGYGQHLPDFNFATTVGLLVFFGLLILSSASSVRAFQQFGDSYWFLKHQILNGLLPGLAFFCFAAIFDYRRWKKYAFLMLVISIGLLFLVFIPGLGVVYNNARSWLKIGPIIFQPAEAVKFTFLVYLATWLENRGQHGLRDVQYGFLPFLFVLGIISALILAQPDLGTLLIILGLSVTVYFIAGGLIKHILTMVVIGLVIVFLAVQIAPYRLERITSFFHPESDPQKSSYQINQAKIAIGSGGIFGVGMGKSRQKFHYLPQVSEDSIFAVMAEELGLIFSVFLLGLFLNFTSRGLKIARAAPDNFGKYLAVGIIGWISFQALINIGAIVGLIPLTGLPLPFISAGGSALVVCLFACGVMVNISKQTKSMV